MTETTESCPKCRGAGEIHGLGCGPKVCRPITLKCRHCDGTGLIASERIEWIRLGRLLKERRMDPYRTMREEAERLGVGVVTLSNAEQGVIDPTPFLVSDAEQKGS